MLIKCVSTQGLLGLGGRTRRKREERREEKSLREKVVSMFLSVSLEGGFCFSLK